MPGMACVSTAGFVSVKQVALNRILIIGFYMKLTAVLYNPADKGIICTELQPVSVT